MLEGATVFIGEFFPIERALCAEEVFLDSKGRLVLTDEDNDEDGVRVTEKSVSKRL